jgi:hypothetical protein
MTDQSATHILRREYQQHGPVYLVCVLVLTCFIAPGKLWRGMRDGWRRGVEQARLARRIHKSTATHTN